jgi:hypothetical protein
VRQAQNFWVQHELLPMLLSTGGRGGLSSNSALEMVLLIERTLMDPETLHQVCINTSESIIGLVAMVITAATAVTNFVKSPDQYTALQEGT